MSALEKWHQEIRDGKRTRDNPLDDLWNRACQEAADVEFARTVTAPQREYLRALRHEEDAA